MNKKTQIPVLGHALRLLTRLGNRPRYESMNALARELGVAPATCYRILKTLHASDWLVPDHEGHYHLSLGLLPIARAMARPGILLEVMQEPLEQLAQLTRLSVKLSVRQGDEHVTLMRVESPMPIAATGRVGSRFPVVLGATGAVLLSGESPAALKELIGRLPTPSWEHETPGLLKKRIRECHSQGWCSNVGRHPRGIDMLAAPLLDDKGQVIAAITLIGLRGDFNAVNRPQCVHDLLMIAQEASSVMPKLPGTFALIRKRRGASSKSANRKRSTTSTRKKP